MGKPPRLWERKIVKMFLTETASGKRVGIGNDGYSSWADAEYMWTDGNCGCDCNRELFFRRASGEANPDMTGVKCSAGRFLLEVYECEELVYSEIE